MAAELISFGTGLDWIKKLWGVLGKRQESYRKSLEEINNTVLNDPLDIAQYYVEPQCQDTNPADHPEEDYPVTKSLIMNRIDQFFQFMPSQLGGNQMIILSDAGMGKTALLTMLKLLHLTAFWSKDHDCVLKKLGKTTLDEIAKIENKRDTILLLDSLDEDTEAFGHVRDRLVSILRATQHFHKTIITCRTQFFPKAESDPFNRPGLVIISGFVCPAKYLSFFSVQQVEEYLLKRFPKKYLFFTDKQKIEEAQRMIAKMSMLRCRPMLLSYIEDLMAMPQLKDKDSEYHVYDALVKSWLIRQESKPDAKVSAKDLLKACIILATIMQIKEKRSIREQELDALIEKIADVLPITKIDIKGKSLINRNSDGDYRFSHFSIQEFLVAKLLIEKPEGKYWFIPKNPIRMSEFILRMIMLSKKIPNFIELLDFRRMDLRNSELRNINLSGANLKEVILRGADLRNADLSNADLTHADLNNANLSSASLIGTNLSKADLRNADFSNADLTYANLNNAEITGTKFTNAKLIGSSMDTFEVSEKFFLGIGFKIISKTINILYLFLKNDLSGIVLLWREENISELKQIVSNLDLSKYAGFKFYIVYKNQTPEATLLHKLRELLKYDIIPISSNSMEEAIYSQKYVETLKELEEPFITRKDPYAESKPIHDPTWFYGRDEMMSRIPAVLAQGQHIGIFGLRKVGKTSLLKQILQRFINVPVSYINCQGYSYSAFEYFEEILLQIYTELEMRKIGRIFAPDKVLRPEDFQKQLMKMFEVWHKKRPEPFMIILDEIDKFFPSRELKDSEAILSEYVKFFKVIRSLAESYQCLTTLVVAYRPHINRHNLLLPSVGENPMFKSFQEEYLGFLSPKDTKSMIQEIGLWKDIVWDDDAAERVFYYCGGHPLVCRYFASMACKGGSLKHIDMERVKFVADDIVKTFRKNDIGNYYKEAVWALLTPHEHAVLAEICMKSAIQEHVSEDHQDALINLERFGLVKTENNMSCLTANLFDSWLRGRLG